MKVKQLIKLIDNKNTLKLYIDNINLISLDRMGFLFFPFIRSLKKKKKLKTWFRNIITQHRISFNGIFLMIFSKTKNV